MTIKNSYIISFILTPYKEHNLALFVNRFLNTGAWHFMINFQIQFKTFPKLLNSKYYKRKVAKYITLQGGPVKSVTIANL